MQLNSHVIVCAVLFSWIGDNKGKAANIAEIGQKQYMEMLKKIVNNNESRLETVKKWYRWNQEGLSDLLNRQADHSEEEEEDDVIILLMKQETQKNANAIDTNQSTKIGKELLRKHWRDKCDKKDMKRCTKACEKAYKSVCKVFVCKSSHKKTFKKNCKNCCKHNFMG